MLLAFNRRLKSRTAGDASGFSFLELVIVVAVIGILTAIAIPSYGGIQNAAKQAAVDTAAQNGLRSATVAQEGMAGKNSAGNLKLPTDALNALKNDVIGLSFLDANGVPLATGVQPVGALCVWAYNLKELDSLNNPKFQSFEGNCKPLNGSIPGGGTGSPSDPGTGNPGTDNPGNETTTSAVFVINCPDTVEWSAPFYDFVGTSTWSDGATSEDNMYREVEAGRDYTITMDGTYSTATGNSYANQCLKRVNSWGSGATDLSGALQGTTEQLEYIAPLPATVKSIAGMFEESSFNGDLSRLNTGNVENMQGLFRGAAHDFNISNWDVSKVKDMSRMFQYAQATPDLSKWDTGSVTSMSSMFQGAASNGSITSWDTSSVTDMSYMFSDSQFNHSIGGWDVSNVQNFENMFSGSAFDRELNSWDVGAGENFAGMFFATSDFNKPLNEWDMTSATNISNMFGATQRFNSSLAGWEFSKPVQAQSTFADSRAFDQPLASWSTSTFHDMYRMFAYSAYTQDISNWDVSNVTFYDMFAEGSYDFPFEHRPAGF